MAVEAVVAGTAQGNVLPILLRNEQGHPHKRACSCLPVSSYYLFSKYKATEMRHIQEWEEKPATIPEENGEKKPRRINNKVPT